MNQLSFFEKEKSTDWKWSLKDYPKKNGLKAFSCFACGGGSTMGYKLAGIDVIGCCEIDPRMNEVYVKNHNPKYNYLMDIRDFNKLEDLPEELYNLDILDGSPPCSAFSTAGEREDSWGKKKVFAEGQKEQTLDDLIFVFCDTIAKLRPKVAIIENVEGLILGNAIKYVHEVYRKLESIGYKARMELLKGEKMGVPQKRHRVFIIATRLDFDLNKIDLSFDYEQITYGEIKEGKQKEPSLKIKTILNEVKHGEKDLVKAWNRLFNKDKKEKRMFFNAILHYDNNVAQTFTAGHGLDFDAQTKKHVNDKTISNASTFPYDFDYKKMNVSYICGMSVPPVMIKRIATRIIESGIFKEAV